MKMPIIRELASKHAKVDLEAAAEALESKGENVLGVEGDGIAEQLTHLLMAAKIRGKMDKGMSLPEALREQSQSVRKILTGLKNNS